MGKWVVERTIIERYEVDANNGNEAKGKTEFPVTVNIVKVSAKKDNTIKTGYKLNKDY